MPKLLDLMLGINPGNIGIKGKRDFKSLWTKKYSN